jgi:hypothetical protein
MQNQLTGSRRRIIASWIILALFRWTTGQAALPPGVEGRQVHMQIDKGALQKIPGDERTDVAVREDTSSEAQALIRATPPGRAIPVIYIVVGILSIPTIWDTIREMLRRDHYGGVLIDARQIPALITHDRSLPADIVLFIGPDGHSQQYESHNLSQELLLQIAKDTGR